MKQLSLDDVVIGQYRGRQGKGVNHPGYLDDDTVPAGRCAVHIIAVFYCRYLASCKPHVPGNDLAPSNYRQASYCILFALPLRSLSSGRVRLEYSTDCASAPLRCTACNAKRADLHDPEYSAEPLVHAWKSCPAWSGHPHVLNSLCVHAACAQHLHRWHSSSTTPDGTAFPFC